MVSGEEYETGIRKYLRQETQVSQQLLVINLDITYFLESITADAASRVILPAEQQLPQGDLDTLQESLSIEFLAAEPRTLRRFSGISDPRLVYRLEQAFVGQVKAIAEIVVLAPDQDTVDAVQYALEQS